MKLKQARKHRKKQLIVQNKCKPDEHQSGSNSDRTKSIRRTFTPSERSTEGSRSRLEKQTNGRWILKRKRRRKKTLKKGLGFRAWPFYISWKKRKQEFDRTGRWCHLAQLGNKGAQLC